MGLTADLALYNVFYPEWRPDGSELLACGGEGQEIGCQFIPTITGVAEGLEQSRFGAAIGMFGIEQIVADLFGCGCRLVCVRNRHRVSKGRTARINGSRLLDYPSLGMLPRVHCIRWCTPVMGVIVWGVSPLCEIGSLKEISRPSDHSDWQSTR